LLVLIKSNSLEFNRLNKGYNNDKSLGLFTVYQKRTSENLPYAKVIETYNVLKPIVNCAWNNLPADIPYLHISGDFFELHCKTILTFHLNNN
jgi:hypothetical protein